jgi:hypothetical protein
MLQIKIFWKQLAWPDVEGSYTFVAKIIDVSTIPRSVTTTTTISDVAAAIATTTTTTTNKTTYE